MYDAAFYIIRYALIFLIFVKKIIQYYNLILLNLHIDIEENGGSVPGAVFELLARPVCGRFEHSMSWWQPRVQHFFAFVPTSESHNSDQ